MLSSTMDCIIFLYLGVALLDLGFNPEDYFWHPGFIIWTLVLCLLVRFIGIYLLTGLSNSFRSVCHIIALITCIHSSISNALTENFIQIAYIIEEVYHYFFSRENTCNRVKGVK